MEGYHRLPSELQGIMLNLNTADDYFKIKRQADSLEEQLSEKGKELYEIKHELISAQIKLETAEKTVTSLQDEATDYQKKIVQLETQLEGLKNQGNVKR